MANTFPKPLFVLILIQIAIALCHGQDTLYLDKFTEPLPEHNGKVIVVNNLFDYTSIYHIENGQAVDTIKEIGDKGTTVIEMVMEAGLPKVVRYLNEDGSEWSRLETDGKKKYGKVPLKQRSMWEEVEFISSFAFRNDPKDFMVAVFNGKEPDLIERYLSMDKPQLQVSPDGKSVVSFDREGNEIARLRYKEPNDFSKENILEGNVFEDSPLSSSPKEKVYREGKLDLVREYFPGSHQPWKEEKVRKEVKPVKENLFANYLPEKETLYYRNGKQKYVNTLDETGEVMAQTNWNLKGEENSYSCKYPKAKSKEERLFRLPTDQEGVLFRDVLEKNYETGNQFVVTQRNYYKENKTIREEEVIADSLLLFSKVYDGEARYYNPQTGAYVTATLSRWSPVEGVKITYKKGKDDIASYMAVYEYTTYADRRKNGLFQRYSEDGLAKEELYSNGKKHGECKYYLEGKLALKMKYDMGARVDTLFTYFGGKEYQCSFFAGCPFEGEFVLEGYNLYTYFGSCPIEEMVKTAPNYGESTDHYFVKLEKGVLKEVKPMR